MQIGLAFPRELDAATREAAEMAAYHAARLYLDSEHTGRGQITLSVSGESSTPARDNGTVRIFVITPGPEALHDGALGQALSATQEYFGSRHKVVLASLTPGGREVEDYAQ